jgi:hypothetical protein
MSEGGRERGGGRDLEKIRKKKKEKVAKDSI